MSKCVTCKGVGYTEDENGDYIHRLSDGEECEECGRPHCFDQIKIRATLVNESGNEEPYNALIDTEGDTPLEAVNRVLNQFSGPRGTRVKSIDRIKRNVTPLLSEEEMGERSVIYEETGLVAHDITLRVDR